jgi:hypothetical protein
MAMAGLPWIKVWTVVGKHPKVQRLEKDLHVPDALGIVVRLWCWTADYCPDGEIPEGSIGAAMVAARGDATRKRGDDVLSSLVSSGFLDRTPDGFRVHDWDEMQTNHVEAVEHRREQNRARQAAYRKRKEEEQAARNAPVTRDVTRDVTDRVTPSNAGDKRREDETRQEERESNAPPHRKGGLPSRHELHDKAHPLSAKLLGWLGERGIALGHADKPNARAATEANVARDGVDVVGERVRLAYASNPMPTLGWYLDAMAAPQTKARPLDPRAPAAPSTDWTDTRAPWEIPS